MKDGRKLTYSNVVSTLCLFLLLGGGSAVALQGKNTVDSGDIKRGAVKRSDVGANAVDGGKVVNGTIGGADVNEASLAGIDAETLDGLDADELGAANVVVSAHGNSTVLAGVGMFNDYPLSDNAWTQAADEIDADVFGTVVFDVPAACVGGESLIVNIKVDGVVRGVRTIQMNGGPFSNQTASLTLRSGVTPGFDGLLAPGAPTPRTLGAEVQDLCGGGDASVESMELAIVGFR